MCYCNLHIKRKALSCIFSSFIVFTFEQKCQAKGQKLKLDNIKECKIVSLLSLDKKKTTNML